MSDVGMYIMKRVKCIHVTNMCGSLALTNERHQALNE